MEELLDLSFSPPNIVPTVFLLFVFLYWIVFLLGFIDLGFLDFDADPDLDLDADIDVDATVGIGKEIGHEPGLGIKFLHFFNIGQVPFMVFFSAFALFYWAFSVLGNYYWAGDNTLRITAVLVSGFIFCALLGKLFTQPFKKIFKEMDKGEMRIDMIGKICTMDLGIESNKLGQALLVHGGKHILITVKTDDSSRIQKGAQVVIMEKIAGKEIYIVAPLEIEAS